MQNKDISLKEYYQDLKNELNEIKELDSEIKDLEQASGEVENKYRLLSRFLDVKKHCKDILLYLLAIVFTVSIINIDLILITLMIATSVLVPCGLFLKDTYQNVKKTNQKIPCFGKSGKESFKFLKSKRMSILNRIEAKKNRKEELSTKLGSYTLGGEFSDDFYNMLFRRVDELDSFYQESLDATIHQDISSVHFDNNIGSEINYTEKTKKLFKKM